MGWGCRRLRLLRRIKGGRWLINGISVCVRVCEVKEGREKEKTRREDGGMDARWRHRG